MTQDQEVALTSVTVRWGRNPYPKPGDSPVMAYHPDGRKAFPSKIGFQPPTPIALARDEWPQEGVEEKCVAMLNPSSTVYFYWPVYQPRVERISNALAVAGNLIVPADDRTEPKVVVMEDGIHIILPLPQTR